MKLINLLIIYQQSQMSGKATPFLEEILHLASLFLASTGHQTLAEELQETYDLPQWVKQNNPLLKKGLVKIVKEFVKNNEKMTKYYTTRGPPEDSEEEEQKQVKKSSKRKSSIDSLSKVKSPKIVLRNPSPKIVQKVESPKVVAKVASPKANNTSSWMSKFQKPKTLEEINNFDAPIQKTEVVHHPNAKHEKQSKKTKKAKIESSDYESEKDSFQLQPKKKVKKDVKEEKKEVKAKEQKKHKKSKKVSESQIQEQQQIPVEKPKKKEAKKVVKQIKDQDEQVAEQHGPVVTVDTSNSNYAYTHTHPKGPLKFFSRINPNEVGPIRDQLKDNSFHAKSRYGQAADEWGQFGYDKLKDTRGESFKKTKGKLKNRAFQGAMMDINKINSIPID